MAAKRYRVLTGLNYTTAKGDQRRADPGTVVTDLPATAAAWLLEQGHIEEVRAP